MGSQLSTIPASDTVRYTAAEVPSDSTWWVYWWGFGVFAFSVFLFSALTFKQPMWDRHHGYVTTLIVLIAMTAYFSMAAHGGDSLIPLYWNIYGARDVFWARYIDWFFTTPLLLLDLLMLAAVPLGTFIWVAIADIAMILFGLFGAITEWRFRWGYYAIGCFFMFVVMYGILVQGTRYAMRRDKKLGSIYLGLSLYLMFLFCLYPVVWGLCEGRNIITMTAEAASYGLLDIFAKVVFGLLMLSVAQPVASRVLRAEREKGVHDISLLEAPVTSPLYGVRQRIPASVANGTGGTVNVDVYPAGPSGAAEVVVTGPQVNVQQVP